MNMTPSELRSRQKELHTAIREKNKDAVCDGVLDIDTYCRLKHKVMWVQKEPPVSTDILHGDVWDVAPGVLDGKNTPTLRWKTEVSRRLLEEDIKRNPLPDKIEFVNGISTYPEDKQMEARTLCCIANINVGKMPAPKSTPDARLLKIHEEWKDITHQQIDAYAPDVIFFSGTFKLFQFPGDLQELWTCRMAGRWKFSIYRVIMGERPTIIVDCYHTGSSASGIYWEAVACAAKECLRF